MIAGLFNIPSNRETMQHFSFYNRDAHELAIAAIRRKTGVVLPTYPLDPIPENDFPSWLYSHQAMHNSINAALGVQGNDLSDVDPQKLDQLTTWIRLHATEHLKWGKILGYG